MQLCTLANDSSDINIRFDFNYSITNHCVSHTLRNTNQPSTPNIQILMNVLILKLCLCVFYCAWRRFNFNKCFNFQFRG